MPFSSELGMRTFDPLAAYQTGLAAASGVDEAFANAPVRQMQMQKMREQAQAMALRQEGMKRYQSKYQELISGGKSPLDAATQSYVEAAPFFDPQGFHTTINSLQNAETRQKVEEGKRAMDLLKIENVQRLIEERRQHSDEIYKLQTEKLELLRNQSEKKLPQADQTRLNSLYSEMRSVNKEIETFIKQNVMPIGKEPPREFMVLKNKQGRLEREIAKLTGMEQSTTASPSVATTPDASTATPSPDTPPTTAGQAAPALKLGATYRNKAGKRAVYIGGDPNDPKSWKELP